MKFGAVVLLCSLSLAAIDFGGSRVPQANRHTIASPNGEVVATVTTGDELTYAVSLRGRALVAASPILLRLDDGTGVGAGSVAMAERREVVDHRIEPVVPEKFSRIHDHYQQMSLDFEGGWTLEVRAYDDGVAYRFRRTRSGPVIVAEEGFSAAFEGDPTVWLHAEESFLTHSERVYRRMRLDSVPPDTFASLPALVVFDDGLKVAITEVDLREYPGLYVTGTSGNTLSGIFPAYPIEEEQVRDRTVQVNRRAEYLARTDGERTFPWRVFVIAEDDGDLIESTMVFRLAPPLRIEDPSWIKPGRVAWDWWNALNLYGVDFKAGVNTETYLYFIDFAAEAGIEYVILDEGWTNPADLWEMNPDVDLERLLAYARERGVGIFPWVVWKTLDDRFEEAMDRFAEWEVAGLKVDFMQRDDQPMVEYYWKVAEAAADRHLLIDFHGAYKPTGLRRAYPNVLTREGVRGLEWSKWSEHPTPEHNVTLPFIRMLAGPMDYTPGAMINAQENQFHAVFDRPMSMGTRSHQLAMFVVFESPLQMLADSPSNYMREQECLSFMVSVPTVWDETRALEASVGEYVAVARRRGETWYVGAMTNWTARELELDLSFLGSGRWSMVGFEDGPNAERMASDYRRIEREFDAGGRLTVKLAPGGGWAARFEPVR
jgi:alpha-glucosidase